MTNLVVLLLKLGNGNFFVEICDTENIKTQQKIIKEQDIVGKEIIK